MTLRDQAAATACVFVEVHIAFERVCSENVVVVGILDPEQQTGRPIDHPGYRLEACRHDHVGEHIGAESDGRILRHTGLTQRVGWAWRIGFGPHRPATESRLAEDFRSVGQCALGEVIKAPLRLVRQGHDIRRLVAGHRQATARNGHESQIEQRCKYKDRHQCESQSYPPHVVIELTLVGWCIGVVPRRAATDA